MKYLSLSAGLCLRRYYGDSRRRLHYALQTDCALLYVYKRFIFSYKRALNVFYLYYLYTKSENQSVAAEVIVDF